MLILPICLPAHPGYTISNYFEDMNYAFVENMQPYFIVRNLISTSDPSSWGVSTLFRRGLLWYASFIPWLPDDHQNAGSSLWLWLAAWSFMTATAGG
jgi:hypothetical protein